MLIPEERERYSRQIMLDSFGEAGQEMLKAASVLVVGAGGLGCPALTYLAAAGVGHLGIVDYDVVDCSNLNRQLLYTGGEVGMKKVQAAINRLNSINPLIKITGYDSELSSENALEIFRPFDIIIDGTDNFAARYVINDACFILGKPWIYGSVFKFEGQVSVFNAPMKDGSYGPDYRSLFPEPLPSRAASSCNETGVIGVIPGITGMLQAGEAIKLICGDSGILSGKLLCFNSGSMSFEIFKIDKSITLDTDRPQTEEEFKRMNYTEYCSGDQPMNPELEPDQLFKLIQCGEVMVVDVREENELTEMNGVNTVHHPWSRIDDFVLRPDAKGSAVFICKHGIMSRKFISYLRAKGIEGKFYSLKGGVEEWNNFNFSGENGHQGIINKLS